MNNDDDVRAGRAALLDLLADLLLHELELSTAASLAGDSALSAVLDPPRHDAQLRELRATYAHLFLMDVPPYASIYLDAPSVIGGATSLEWERFLAAHGQSLPSLERAAAPDHAGLYLRALAIAERDGMPEPLLREALRWLPQALTAIVRQDPAGFYARVADLAAHVLQACAATWRSAGNEIADATSPELEDEGLREITYRLSTPALSGWVLSKHTLRQLARPFGVSIGIADHNRMLERVFEASALDNRIGELLDALLREWQGWWAAHAMWRSELSTWAEILHPWETHLRYTHGLLLHMRSALTNEG